MEHRRRQASASTSTSQSHDDRPAKGSGSATPRPEDEEDGTSRRTRGRNPLPPSSGPLFPALPPKIKNSPKASSRSPAGRTARLSSSSALTNAVNDEDSNMETRDPSPTKGAPPSMSGSLSPPPADGDDLDSKKDNGGDWEAYRRGRGVRGFNASKAVKVEQMDVDEPAAAKTTGSDSNAEAASGTATAASEPAARDAPDTGEAEETNDTEEVNGTEGHKSGDTSLSNSVEPKARKRRGEDQLLLDDHLLPKEIRVAGGQIAPRREKPGGKKAAVEEQPKQEVVEEAPEPEEEEADVTADATEDAEEGDEDDDGKDITRCVCKREDIDVMMIQCDKCNVWQHGACMGIWGDDEAPDEYFCEECRPDLHVPLRKWIRHCGRNPANFTAPTPADLQKLHSSSDKLPPSQSKRWTDPELMEPPPPPKPPSRAQRRDSEMDSDRRSSRRGAASSHKPTSKDGSRSDRRRGRRVSNDLSTSTSPPPRSEPRKRSTMNSRDAAYEDEVKAALEASRREMSGGAEDTDTTTTAQPRKRRRDEDTAEVEEKRPKKKKDDDETSEAPPAPPKPKHPNQYTYRPKGAAPSPARRHASTPQPGLPPTHDHGTRRAGAIASNLAQVNYTASSIHHLNWYLPDHLSAHEELLPTATPEPLIVPTPRNLQFLTRSHFLNQRYGPFTEERGPDGKLIMPEDRPLRDVEGEPSCHRQPPTRVRFPMKRMQLAEMGRRVGNVLEYVGRVQHEETRRLERAKLLGVPEGNVSRKLPPMEEDPKPKRKRADEEEDAPQPDEVYPGPSGPSSSVLLDELTRDLIAFQEAFQTGDFEGLTFAQPPVRPPPGPEPTPMPEPIPIQQPAETAEPSEPTEGAAEGGAGDEGAPAEGNGGAEEGEASEARAGAEAEGAQGAVPGEGDQPGEAGAAAEAGGDGDVAMGEETEAASGERIDPPKALDKESKEDDRVEPDAMPVKPVKPVNGEVTAEA